MMTREIGDLSVRNVDQHAGVAEVNKSSAREASTSAAAPKRMGTPAQYLCDYWSGWVRLPRCVKSKEGLGNDKVSFLKVMLENGRDLVLNVTLKNDRMMSIPVFVDPESSTQADGAQSSRVPVPLLEDPYEAIRTARMAVRVPHAMSSGLSASMAEVAGMSESALCKRFRSSYESSPSVSPLDLPSRKRYHGTSELVEDSEEDEEIEESMDSDSVSEDTKDEGPTIEDEDPAAEDEGLTAGVEGPSMDDEGYGLDNESCGIDDEGHSVESDGLDLEEKEAVPGGQQQATPVVGTTAPESERPERVSAFRQSTLTTWTNPEDGMIYIDIPDYPPPAPPVQTPPSPKCTSGSLPISLSHSNVPSPISSPMIPFTVPSPVATPAAVKTEGFLIELGA
ncbi:hypothetical protein Tco_0348168 [Tanacetum coccineum]